MKKVLNSLSLQQILIMCAILVVCFVFYWFAFRPSQIKSQCTHRARHEATEISKLYDPDSKKVSKDEVQDAFWLQDRVYEYCLRENGI